MIVKCEYCGKEYYIRPSHYKRHKHHFCSKSCQYKGMHWKHSVELKCEICGKIFKRPFAWIKKRKECGHIYCSRECHAISRRINGNVKCKCDFCGKEILVPKSRFKRTRLHFCNSQCRNKFLQVSFEKYAPKIFLYNGHRKPDAELKIKEDKSRVGRASWKKLAQRIRERDCYVCQICGKFNSNHVHHIVPWRISRDDSPENLITLCRTCHAIIERRLKELPTINREMQ